MGSEMHFAIYLTILSFMLLVLHSTLLDGCKDTPCARETLLVLLIKVGLS
jgi:hypothetical protein